MHAFRARLDGKDFIIPHEARSRPPGVVIFVFQNGADRASERSDGTRLQESAFAAAWDNEEDEVGSMTQGWVPFSITVNTVDRAVIKSRS